MLLFGRVKAPFTTKSAFAPSVDQDQAAQNVQPDLGSRFSQFESRETSDWLNQTA